MLADAAERFKVGRDGLVSKIKANRQWVKVLPVSIDVLRQASDIAKEEGLMTNDSVTIALMKRASIPYLASNDDDFDQVASIVVWKPR